MPFKIILGDGRTLFKAIEGSRKIPRNKWLKAEKKMVRDGSGGTEYLSGIHVFKEKKKAESYLENFFTDKNRVVIECKAKGLRQKPTNPDVYLADEIYWG